MKMGASAISRGSRIVYGRIKGKRTFRGGVAAIQNQNIDGGHDGVGQGIDLDVLAVHTDVAVGGEGGHVGGLALQGGHTASQGGVIIGGGGLGLLDHLDDSLTLGHSTNITGTESIPVLQHAIQTLEAMECDISQEERQEYEEQGATGYWLPTRANAIKPLYQLLALARLRPDGVWDGD